MPSLRELITGRDPEKEAKVRAGAQAFAAEHDPEDHAPQEEGLKDSSFLTRPKT